MSKIVNFITSFKASFFIQYWHKLFTNICGKNESGYFHTCDFLNNFCILNKYLYVFTENNEILNLGNVDKTIENYLKMIKQKIN